MRRIRIAAPLFALALFACGDAGSPTTDDADTGVGDTALGDAGLDTGADTGADVAQDVPDTSDATDASAGSDAFDASDTADAALDTGADTSDVGPDADTGPDPSECACDVTAVCDEGCACDLACTIEVGPSPLGVESIGIERNEIAVFASTDGDARLDTLAMYDDSIETIHPQLYAGDIALDRSISDLSFAADVDEDGREEAVLVTATGVQVFDWDGTAFTGRVVHTYPAADWFDAAAGDLDHDGGRVLVVSRQVGETVTIDALDLGSEGPATLRATVEVTDVSRHAITTGALAAGETPLLHVVVTRDAADFREPAERLQYRLDEDALIETRRVEMEAFCSVGLGAEMTDDGFAVAIEDFDARPGREFFIAAYCPTASGTPNLQVAAFNVDGDATHRANPAIGDVNAAVAAAGRVRPLVATGRFRAPSGDPEDRREASIVVGWTGAGPVARYATFDTRFAFTRQLSYVAVDAGSGVMTGVALRDVDGDGGANIVTAVTAATNRCVPLAPCLWYGGATVTARGFDSRNPRRMLYADRDWPVLTEDYPGALLAVGDFDQDSMRVRATGQVYRHLSGPLINNVVAAPPTWHRDDVTHATGSETTFEVSASEGVSHGGIATWGLSISAGIGVSAYKIVELYGYVTASVGVTHTWTFTTTTTFSRAISAGDAADLVSYYRVVYASHEYEVVAHPDPELLGQLIRVDVPGPNYESTTSVEQFREQFEHADELLPPGLLAHTVGQPDTYDIGGACTREALQERIGAGVVSAVYQSTELTDVGNAPSGSRSLTVDIETQYATGTDVVLEVGGVVGGALVVGGSVTGYVGGGYSYQRTLSRSGTYSGTVGVISDGYGPDTRYQWGLCLYQWADAEDPQVAAYPVTTYVVTRY